MKRWTSSIQLGDTPHLKVTQESAPWWVFTWLNIWLWAVDHTPEFTVPLVGRIPITRDGERYTIEEYYGDCPCCWMSYWFSAYSQWLWKRIKSLGEVTMPLDKAIELWGDNAPKWWIRETEENASR
jgi:hypothetical protein